MELYAVHDSEQVPQKKDMMVYEAVFLFRPGKQWNNFARQLVPQIQYLNKI